MYNIVTNFRKTELYMKSISPENIDISQKVIFSDVRYDKCPLSCDQEDSFCKEFDGNSFGDMQLVYGKCLPTLYVYVVNTKN